MDTVVLVGRLLVSLAVVLGVLWLVARRANRRGGRRRQSPIEVLGRQQLGRHSAVAVVRVAGQTLILGVTEGAVSLLTTAEEDEAAAVAADEPAEPVPAARHSAVPSRTRVKAATPERSTLSGSALSPGTWRQTVDALRDLTARAG